MNINKTLLEIGLRNSEIEVYLTLNKLGITKSGKIINETKLSSSRVYATLESLIKLGLASFITKNNIKYYKAESPEILLDLLEEKKKKVKSIIQKIKQLKQVKEDRTYVAIYEGFRGFKAAFELIIRECNSKDEILTFGFSEVTYAFKTLRLFLKQIDRKRIKQKIPMRIIFPNETRKTIGKDRENEKYTEVKYLPENYFFPSAMNIFKEYTLIEVWEETPLVILIKNNKITQSFKNHFDLMWGLAKK